MDSADRDRLILEHLAQVELIASRIAKSGVPIQFNELVSVGTMGLIAAVDSYEPARGHKLKTYAEGRIRGAILDYLRKCDWASRHRRRKLKAIDEATSKAGHKNLATPSSEHVACELGVSLEEFHELQAETHGIDLGSLDDDKHGTHRAAIQRIRDIDANAPDYELQRAAIADILRYEAQLLPQKERVVVVLYFWGGLTLKEISERLGIHISRVVQLKANALFHLRSSILDVWPRRGDRVRARAA